ncbi:THAP domain-containing protein 5-like isoform X1 [Leptidea sinapis]|uniref:THAP domain-containing protein 5-like isoform X1 n=1 Tax=Leptidea sinapis TaxID=189913 RepID=UPI0021C409D0|nr:THAP domain-containing protein 5-like isoform X1 [Leptidea sinapis]
MTYCIVKGCYNASHNKKRKEKKITFHSFPSNPIAAARWIDKIRLNRKQKCWKPTKYSMICSEHFDDKEIYGTKGGYSKLVQNAIPTKGLHIFCRDECHNSNDNLNDPPNLDKTRLGSSCHEANENNQNINCNVAEGSNEPNTTNKISDAPMSDDNAEYEVIIKSEVDSDDEGHREPTSQLPQVTQYSTPALNVQPSTSTMNYSRNTEDTTMYEDKEIFEAVIKREPPSHDETSSTIFLPHADKCSPLFVNSSASSVNNTAMTEGNTKSGVIIKREPDFDSEYSGNIDIVHTDVRINSLQEQSKCNLSGLYEDSKTLIWAKKLARMTPQQRLLAEKAIDQVLNEAELGNLREGSVRIN